MIRMTFGGRSSIPAARRTDAPDTDMANRHPAARRSNER